MDKISILESNVNNLEEQLHSSWEKIKQLKKIESLARDFIEKSDSAHKNEPWAGFTSASNEEKKAYVKLRESIRNYGKDQRS